MRTQPVPWFAMFSMRPLRAAYGDVGQLLVSPDGALNLVPFEALVDEEGETLRFVASDGAGAEAIVGVTIPVSRGIAGWAAMSGQPISVRDVQTDARFARDVERGTPLTWDLI